MEAPYSCDHNTRQGQTYWRLDTKKNLSLADICTYLRMQPPVSELHQFEKETADALGTPTTGSSLGTAGHAG